MTNKKNTKRALASSALALLMCMAMLIGTTFAWFTDTASTAVNKIQAGKLDVALEYAKSWDAEGNPTEWEDAEGKMLTFKTADNRVAADILWEPGCTYELPELRIINNGNLALKYKIIITGIDGDAKLNEVIDWTMELNDDEYQVDGEYRLAAKNGETVDADVLTIKGHMQETAGNEYQDLTIDGIGITVVATQDTVENDSFNNLYDENATYLNTDKDGNVLINNANELRYFARTAKDGVYSGKTVKLMKNIDLQNESWTPIAGDGIIFDGNNHTISNLKVSGEKNVGLFGTATNCVIKNLTVDGAVVKGINHVAVIAGDALCAKIENCIVKNAEIVAEVKNNDDGDKAGAIAGYVSAEPNASVKGCVVEKCTVKGYRDIGGLVGYVNGSVSGANAEISGNTVKKSVVINDQSVNYKNYTADSMFDVNQIIGEAAGTVLQTPENTSTETELQYIKAAGSQEELNEALNNAQAGTTVVIPTNTTVKIDDTASLQNGVTLNGAGKENSVLEVEKAKITSNNVTIKDITIKGSGSAGNDGTLNVRGNNTTIENVDYKGDGNIAVTVSTGANNTGTVFKKTKITNAFRGIQFWQLSGDSLIEDCELNVAGYTFNIDATVADSTLTIRNTILNGWTSYTNGIKLVSFENCKLGLNTYEYLRPYSETSLTGCEFTSAGYRLNAGGSAAYTIKLTNCTKNGTAITADNVKTLLLDTEDWNQHVTLIVNGTVVSL